MNKKIYTNFKMVVTSGRQRNEIWKLWRGCPTML